MELFKTFDMMLNIIFGAMNKEIFRKMLYNIRKNLWRPIDNE